MLSVKDSTLASDLGQLQDISYHLSQMEHHLKSAKLSRDEFDYHLRKFDYHENELKGASNATK